jgi:hypothetical protein
MGDLRELRPRVASAKPGTVVLPMEKAVALAEAERFLRRHSPDQFADTIDAWHECIEAARLVEDTEAWRHGDREARPVPPAAYVRDRERSRRASRCSSLPA